MGSSSGPAGLATTAGTETAALAGLDNLELRQASDSAGDRARRIWAGVWPKLLAIAIVIGIWELIHLSGWKNNILPGPAAVFSDLWAQLHHALLWQAIGTTLRRAVIGFALAIIIGVIVGPGHSALTRMLLRAYSIAAARVSPRMPCLLAI